MTSHDPSSGRADPSSAVAHRSFDTRRANTIEWVLLGTAPLILLFSFVSFYTYDLADKGADQCRAGADGGFLFDIGFCDYNGSSGDTVSAWHGIFGWLGVLLLMIAAAAVPAASFITHLSHPVQIRLAGACAAVLGVIFVGLAALDVPNWPNWPRTVPFLSPPVVLHQSVYDSLIAGHVGSGWYVVLALGVVVAVSSVLRLRQTPAGNAS